MHDTDDAQSVPLPRMSRVRHLAWGLASFGLTFILVIVVGSGASVAVYKLRSSGWVRPLPSPKNLAEPLVEVPEAIAIGIGGAAVVGPLLMAGTIAALRPRWWMGFMVGFVLGWIVTGLLSLIGNSNWEIIATVPTLWVLCGTFGGAMSALRRRIGA